MLCRLCLNESPNYLYIFGSEGDERDDKLEISEVIWKYIHIQIKAKDKVSNLICRRCWQQLYDFHLFCLDIIEKQELLKQQNQVAIQSHSSSDAQSIVEGDADDYEDEVDIKNVPLYQPQIDDEKLVKNERTSPPTEVCWDRRKSKRTKDDFKGVFITNTKLPAVEHVVDDPLSNENNSTRMAKKPKTNNKKKLKQTNAKSIDALFEQQIDEKPSETKDSVFADCLLEASVETDDDVKDDDDDFVWPMAATDTEKKKRKMRRKPNESLTPKKKKETVEANFQFPPHMIYTDDEMDAFIAQHASLKCCKCDENLFDFHDLKRHYRVKHQCVGYIICCRKRFSKRTFFVDHLKTHFDPNFISCIICKKAVSGRNALKSHFATFHVEEKDSTIVQEKKETSESNFQLPPHMIYTDAEMDAYIAQHGSLKCCLCDENLLDFHHLKRHFREKHKCEGYINCCKKRFTQRTFYVDHLKTHFDPNFISCVICKKSLAGRNALRNHLAIFHPQEEELKYECTECSRKFAKEYMRRQHIKFHHPPDEEMKFECKDCGLKFARVNFLRQHVKEKHKKIKEKKDSTKPQQNAVAELSTASTSLNYNSANLQYNSQNLYNFTNPYTYDC